MLVKNLTSEDTQIYQNNSWGALVDGVATKPTYRLPHRSCESCAEEVHVANLDIKGNLWAMEEFAAGESKPLYYPCLVSSDASVVPAYDVYGGSRFEARWAQPGKTG
ncbi:hypothetical protein [Halocalculus aciditolerans]|uniref:hypothetical protein n=1 Tax=Halocalculus aciditolerans TaxID=1383812 RepID=UPI0016664F02|nr:hypothetical protein [Halocalculus aciditolerans]